MDRYSVVEVWTDGSYNQVSGEGAWAYIAITEKGIEEASSTRKNTNSQEMEIEAIIRALKKYQDAKRVLINTDQKAIAENEHRPQAIINASEGMNISWRWSKGVSKEPWATQVHALANYTRRRVEVKDAKKITRDNGGERGRELIEEGRNEKCLLEWGAKLESYELEAARTQMTKRERWTCKPSNVKRKQREMRLRESGEETRKTFEKLMEERKKGHVSVRAWIRNLRGPRRTYALDMCSAKERKGIG